MLRTAPGFIRGGGLRRLLVLQQMLLVSATIAPGARPGALDLRRAILHIPPSASKALACDGCVVLRQALQPEAVPSPLHHTWRPSSLQEELGVEAECRLAAAISCTLLKAAAVCDPAGECACTTPYEHYAVAGLLDDMPPNRAVIVVLPRQPMTLQFSPSLPVTGGTAAASLRLLHHRNRYSTFTREDGFSTFEQESLDLDVSDAIDIDAGDAVVISGDHSAFCSPPDGIAPAPMIYRFAACDADDVEAIYHSPTHDAKLSLERSHLEGLLDLHG